MNPTTRSRRVPDLRFRWMRRYDFSWVELIFCAAVLSGGLVTLLTPSRVARVVELSGPAADNPTAALILTVAIVGVLVHHWSTIWGPVRVGRATARWVLSGPDDRTRPLARRLVTVGAAMVACCAATSAILATLHPASIAAVLSAGAAVGLPALGAAYARQLREDRRRSPRERGLSPKHLHRNSFAPHDGYADALQLAASMLDTTWLTDNRVARWQRRHMVAPRRRLPASWFGAAVELDRRRLLRHPDACVRWLICTATIACVPQLVTLHQGATLVVAMLVYSAGNSLTGGLRSVAGAPALRRSFGLADRPIMVAHMAIPSVGVIVSCGVAVAAWQLPLASAALLLCGILFAVYRRATRPPLPYDSPAISEPLVTGAVIQPQLLTSMMRGPIAVLATAAAVGLL